MSRETQLHVDETAQAMIARYGRDARLHAEFRADTLHAQGELRAALTWRMVMRAISAIAAERVAASAIKAVGV
jgi:hypothetical protein